MITMAQHHPIFVRSYGDAHGYAIPTEGDTWRMFPGSIGTRKTLACVSNDQEPMGPWPAHILSVAQEVADMAEDIP